MLNSAKIIDVRNLLKGGIVIEVFLRIIKKGDVK